MLTGLEYYFISVGVLLASSFVSGVALGACHIYEDSRKSKRAARAEYLASPEGRREQLELQERAKTDSKARKLLKKKFGGPALPAEAVSSGVQPQQESPSPAKV
ncbi:hypothetical protein LTR53_016559 [Teratosphaeriaceae sp. CCFEE 6253]|nr:hypothetical protein LTR53_016559 [Teratosphaeriaceae sp. CCFEE 6253]